MSKIQIGPFSFTVLEQRGNRIKISWTEASGITKERWLTVIETSQLKNQLVRNSLDLI